RSKRPVIYGEAADLSVSIWITPEINPAQPDEGSLCDHAAQSSVCLSGSDFLAVHVQSGCLSLLHISQIRPLSDRHTASCLGPVFPRSSDIQAGAEYVVR